MKMVVKLLNCQLFFCIVVKLYVERSYIMVLSFLKFKEFELYWGAVFFITTRRGVLEKSFWRSPREKIWSDFGAEQKRRAERKESGFCSNRCF